jgi:Leu/Phe-tRNA-protein transferase
MLLYEMIHKRPIFDGMSTSQVVTLTTKGKRPDFTVHCSDDFKQLIEKCWAQNPEERPSFIKIRIQLERILESRPKLPKLKVEEEKTSLEDDIVFE